MIAGSEHTAVRLSVVSERASAMSQWGEDAVMNDMAMTAHLTARHLMLRIVEKLMQCIK